ncbi:MAG: MerR family DNA-binding transcriptional regulator [Actinomycetes bacterium]
MRLLTTGELARELGVSRGAVLKWATADPPLITPDFTTPGGHHRWDPDRVREQLRQQRQRGDAEG